MSAHTHAPQQRKLELSIPADDAFAEAQGVSLEAVQILRAADVVDTHLDTFIPPRLYRYDLFKRHGRGVLGGRMFGHLDFPRVLEGGLTGGMWSITTNPFRTAKGRWKKFQANLERFRRTLVEAGERFRVVRTHSEYEAARRDGLHGCLLSIQGGNCLEAAPEGVGSIPDDIITRVTLVHLTNSIFGTTSSPLALWRKKRGLSDRGRALVEQLNAQRVFVDLAHINPPGFWDAVEVHDRSQPLIATHTGVNGVRKCWRNLDDDQIKAIADTGGVIGVVFHKSFLRRRGGPKDCGMVVDHIEHVIAVGGEDAVCLGSDYDGAIVPPSDLRSGTAYVRLVQKMLDRGFAPERVNKVLGANFLRSLRALRP